MKDRNDIKILLRMKLLEVGIDKVGERLIYLPFSDLAGDRETMGDV